MSIALKENFSYSCAGVPAKQKAEAINDNED